MADFSNKLAAQGSAGPQFFSDHPNPGNRQAAIQKQIAAWLPETYSSNDAVFKVARQQALGVKAYSAEEIAQGAKANQWAKLNHQNGAIVKPPAEAAISSASLVSPATAEGKAEPIGLQRVLPSSRFVTSDLGPMKIDHPDNWQVIAPEQKGPRPQNRASCRYHSRCRRLRADYEWIEIKERPKHEPGSK
jgi:hypothetical protein